MHRSFLRSFLPRSARRRGYSWPAAILRPARANRCSNPPDPRWLRKAFFEIERGGQPAFADGSQLLAISGGQMPGWRTLPNRIVEGSAPYQLHPYSAHNER